MAHTPLGSDSWSTEPRYQDAYRLRLDFVLGRVPALTLQDLASSLRNGVECTISSNYAAGEFNLVKKIIFADDVCWVVRIRLPPISHFRSSLPEHGITADELEDRASDIRCTERDLEALRSEIMTMKYLRERSIIPIPRVYTYSLLIDNVVGFPYIFMDYIHGTTAFHLSTGAGNPMAVPEQYVDHYYNQIAKIMLELASFRFGRIGSLTGDPSSDVLRVIEVGPIAETGEGPYETAREFYNQYPAALGKALHNDPTAPSSGGSETIRRLPAFLETVGSAPFNTYGLVNLELGTHNVLVNESFDVLAVIDWDSVIAAPSAVLHQFPWCIGGDPGIPGVGAIRPFGDWDGRMDMCRKFAKLLEKKAADVDVKQGQRHSFSAVNFFTREALAFRALAFFRVKVGWVDEEWLPGLDWMQRHSDDDLLQWYEMTPTATYID